MEAPRPKSKRNLILAIAGGLLITCVLCVIVVNLSGKKEDSGQVAQATTAATSAPAVQATEVKATDVPAPTEAPKPAIAKVGERAESGGLALTVNAVSTADKIQDIFEPEEGNVYLVLEVTIESVDKDEAPYNPLYFKIKDADGFEYNTAMLAPDPSLKSGELAKGEKVRGNVAFEVKKDAKGFIVSYEPLVLFGGYEPIKVDLGQ